MQPSQAGTVGEGPWRSTRLAARRWALCADVEASPSCRLPTRASASSSSSSARGLAAPGPVSGAVPSAPYSKSRCIMPHLCCDLYLDCANPELCGPAFDALGLSRGCRADSSAECVLTATVPYRSDRSYGTVLRCNNAVAQPWFVLFPFSVIVLPPAGETVRPKSRTMIFTGKADSESSLPHTLDPFVHLAYEPTHQIPFLPKTPAALRKHGL